MNARFSLHGPGSKIIAGSSTFSKDDQLLRFKYHYELVDLNIFGGFSFIENSILFKVQIVFSLATGSFFERHTSPPEGWQTGRELCVDSVDVGSGFCQFRAQVGVPLPKREEPFTSHLAGGPLRALCAPPAGARLRAKVARARQVQRVAAPPRGGWCCMSPGHRSPGDPRGKGSSTGQWRRLHGGQGQL